MKVLLGTLLTIVLVSILAYFLFFQDKSSATSLNPTPTNIQPEISQPIDTQATFAIFTNGTKRIFTDPRYHNKSETVYLESTNPDVIHIKKSGTTWGDFFSTLPMEVTTTCLTTGTGQKFCNSSTHTLKFYINNTTVSDALTHKIQPHDKLLISYGVATDPEISSQLEQVPSTN